jgi:hypothetical protein
VFPKRFEERVWELRLAGACMGAHGKLFHLLSQTREHNKANEVTGLQPGAVPQLDTVGNMTRTATMTASTGSAGS